MAGESLHVYIICAFAIQNLDSHASRPTFPLRLITRGPTASRAKERVMTHISKFQANAVENSDSQHDHPVEVVEVDPCHRARLSVYDGRDEQEFGSFIGG